MEYVLVVGASGNIGGAAVTAALRSKKQVIAVVRNKASAAKLFQNVGTEQGITIVEADVASPSGIQGVVDKVKSGELPHFQHVFSTAGGVYTPGKLSSISDNDLKANMHFNFETNFYAYRATIPYLLSQQNNTSWTLQTGMEGEFAITAVSAMSQGALFTMATAACRELENTSIRFNEIRLGARVESDPVAEVSGSVKASRYADVYAKVLDSPDMKGGVIRVIGAEGVDTWKFEKNQGALLQF